MDKLHQVHKLNLLNKIGTLKNDVQMSIFNEVKTAYEVYEEAFSSITVFDENAIRTLVDALNTYRRIAIPVFDCLDNSGQQALGYTIMEEFFFLFFHTYLKSEKINYPNLFLGKGNSYVSLSFTPKSFESAFKDVSPYIHSKDQDFVLGVSVDIKVESADSKSSEQTILPIVAIECKTYLEKNMLDSCANTASRLKRAMPYCLYMVASEYMKMSEASPELTDIDEVYILCKAKNSERLLRAKQGLSPFDIDSSLILDLFYRVKRHFDSIWWNPSEAVTNGKIICRP